jgi:hypothetical protein
MLDSYKGECRVGYRTLASPSKTLSERVCHTPSQMDTPLAVDFVDGTPLVSDAGNHRMAFVTQVEAYCNSQELLGRLHEISHKRTPLSEDDVEPLQAVLDMLKTLRVRRHRDNLSTCKR